jgi:hypothetical protein
MAWPADLLGRGEMPPGKCTANLGRGFLTWRLRSCRRLPGHLLQGQAVSVGVGEPGVLHAAADVDDVADVAAAADELFSGLSDFVDHLVQAVGACPGLSEISSKPMPMTMQAEPGGVS